MNTNYHIKHKFSLEFCLEHILDNIENFQSSPLEFIYKFWGAKSTFEKASLQGAFSIFLWEEDTHTNNCHICILFAHKHMFDDGYII